MLSLEQGAKLIRLARDSIKAGSKNLRVSPAIKREFSQKQGVFVTLQKNGYLRGCIGFVEPIYTLYEGVISAAKSAAFSDPRFMPLTEKEFNSVSVEVSVLTPPKIIEVRNPEDYTKMIKIGRVKIFSLNFASEVISSIGNVLTNYAILLAPVVMVFLVGSFQPAILLILTIICTKFFQKLLLKTYLRES